jgi:hypothetical protein
MDINFKEKNIDFMKTLLRHTPFALLLLVMSCSNKDNTVKPTTPETPTGKYYFKYKVNGKPYEYYSSSTGQDTIDIVGGVYGGGLHRDAVLDNDTYGFQGSLQDFPGPYPSIAFTLETPNPLVTNKEYIGTVEKKDNKGYFRFQLGIEDDTFKGGVDYYNDEDIRITLTDINDKYYVGTFSGALLSSDVTSGVNITDGEFYLLRDN